jgi:hypothetical protein
MVATDKTKTIIVNVIEGVFATVLVFICFLLFTAFLKIIFPPNLSPILVPATATDIPTLEKPHWRRLLLDKDDVVSNLDANQKMVATLAKIRNSVKCKRSISVSWEKGRAGMSLYSQDALQTLSNASALIEFDEQNRTRLDENSLIIIKQLEKDLIFNEKRTFVLLVEGALRTQLSPSPVNATCLNLETPQATLRMHARDGLTDARVVAGPDKTATLSVFQGAVEITTQRERRTVRANQAIRIPLEKPLEALISLPEPVKELSPQDMSQHFIKKRSDPISFSWQQQPHATGYHFMLARDSNFKDLVLDKTIANNHLNWNDFTPGTYYWRVSRRVDDIEGYFSNTHRLHVYRQTPPPQLLSDYPPEKVYYRSVVPMIGFAWRKSTGLSPYYWQIARDESFSDIVEKKALQSNRINSDSLARGVYYWRVGIRNAPNQPIIYSAARRFEIIQDSVPPLLEVEFPATAVCHQPCSISGRTEPGARVFVGGHAAKVTPSGRFTYTMRLNDGKNVVAVAATDAANNVTSKSQIVICK